jgi:sulfite exporter TauE/SafE
MNMSTIFFLGPFFAGLSMGAFCLTYCLPFLAPFIACEQRALEENAALVLHFILGRLLGYILFGLIFGFLGEKFHSHDLTLLTDVTLIGVSLVLVFYIVGLLKPKEKTCPAQGFQSRNALAMGFLMGINICPPFLLSLTYVFSLHSICKSVGYFLVFFIASSIYFLPVMFLGPLAKIREVKTVARFSGLITAAIFIVYGIYSLARHL